MKAIEFADNLMIMIEGKSIKETENHANMEINKITAWTKNNKSQFNKQKFKVMVLSRRKRKEINIYLNNKPQRVEKMKYLRIIFNNKLTFREFIYHIEERCIKLIFSLSKSVKISQKS